MPAKGQHTFAHLAIKKTFCLDMFKFLGTVLSTVKETRVGMDLKKWLGALAILENKNVLVIY